MKQHWIKSIALVMVLAGVLPALADSPAGIIKTSRGTAEIQRMGSVFPAGVGAQVMVKDTIVTGADGIVGITLKDNTRLTAGPDTSLALDQYAFDTSTHAGALNASVNSGSLSVISGQIAKSNPDAVQFRTPTVTLGVRGTEFIIETGE